MKTINEPKAFVFQLQCQAILMETNEAAVANLETRICGVGGFIAGKTVARDKRCIVTNIWVTAQPAQEFWQKFASSDDRYRGPLERLIVVRQEQYGWDDYQLLYHYDKSEKIDELVE